MSADILQFLKNKFMDELEEAEEEHPPPHDIPLHSYFLQIRELLETKSLTPSTGMKDCLYDLSIALTDCILFLEKRKMKINKDSSQGQGQEQGQGQGQGQEQGQGQGQGQGHYSLPELWFLCKTKRKLIHIKKKLRVATHHPVVPEQTSLSAVTDVATTSSSSSGSLSFDGPTIDPDYSYYLIDRVKNIEKLVLGTSELDGEGFSKEIGIVGIGGCGKTLVAQMVFEDSRIVHVSKCSKIWINLQAIQKGEIDFKKILKAMLKQCDDFGDGSVEVEELLEALCKALWSKSYLLVFDGIWDINLDWYFRLKKRLQWCNKSNQSRLIIITTRLHGVAKRMVGPNNLYRMQPFSNQDIWDLISVNIGMNEYSIPEEHPIVVKMEDEMIYHSHGLPLAATTFFTIMENRVYGGDWKHIDELVGGGKLVYYVMINPKDDANQGNDLLLSLRSIFPESRVPDISEVVPQFPLHHIQKAFGLRSDSEVVDRVRILVFGGDATTNRVLQAFYDNYHPTPPIGVMPLGTQVNISISLGWGNQLSDTDSRPAFFLPKLRDAEEILIDSWNFVMRTSIPDCLEIPKTLRVQHVSEDDLLLMEGDKDLCGRFWNYLIIGLDAQECFGDSYFKSWPRNITLPIIVKIKDQQHQWKKLKLPRSIRSIVCLNMPSFPGGLDPWGKPNFRRKKERNFTSSFVDDGLLEIIGFRDSWHAEKFLPLNCHGTRLAQVHQIRFELCKGIAKHIYLSFDGMKWKQHTPIGDDNYMIEISYSSKTRMLATSASKCKQKARSPTSIEYSQQPFQGYSFAEEEEKGYSSAEEEENDRFSPNSSEEDDQNDVAYAPLSRPIGDKPSFDFPTASSGSALPSAFDAFSEISGPPDFLNNCVQEQASAEDVESQRRWHGGWKNPSEKELPAGAVVKSKAQLVGIHERVRSDIEGNLAPKSSVQPPKGSLSTTQGEGKWVATAANPNAEDAAELLRMCMQCGIPKTYSSARGMVCPQCGDRPLEDANKETDKKKGSTIKEKEKNKRMKGQSSHASWKSETEMQLRQQYD